MWIGYDVRCASSSSSSEYLAAETVVPILFREYPRQKAGKEAIGLLPKICHYLTLQWLGVVVVRAPDSRSADRGFDSRPRHCPATTLGKLFTPMRLCSPSSIICYLARAFMSARRMWQPMAWVQ